MSTAPPEWAPCFQGSPPERQFAIRRAVLAHCEAMGWAAVNEFALPRAGRRIDIMALTPDHSLVCIEVKSGPRDFLADRKWPDYRDWSDRLYFAVDDAFPLDLLPAETGIIRAGLDAIPAPFQENVLAECAVLREPGEHRLAPARRRTLLHLFAMTAARRLMTLEDPAISASLRAARRLG